jgi:hypothetical protein
VLIAVRGRERCRLGRGSPTQVRVGWDRLFDLQDPRRRPLPILLPDAIRCDNGESKVPDCPLGTTGNKLHEITSAELFGLPMNRMVVVPGPVVTTSRLGGLT